MPCCAMSCADRGHDGQPDQRAQQLDPAVRLREHQLPLLQPHDEHRQHGAQLGYGGALELAPGNSLSSVSESTKTII